MKRNQAKLSDKPELGKYMIYVYDPECPICHYDQYHVIGEWGNAGAYYLDPGQPPLEGGFTGDEVQCEGCLFRSPLDHWFYTDDERAAALLVSDDDTQPIDIIQ